MLKKLGVCLPRGLILLAARDACPPSKCCMKSHKACKLQIFCGAGTLRNLSEAQLTAKMEISLDAFPPLLGNFAI